MISAAELEAICEALLTEGVPPGVVSRVFKLDLELIKTAQAKVRVRRYGTEDLSEYLEQIQWDTLDELKRIIHSGSPSDKVKFAGMMTGKLLAVSGKRTPEKTREATDRVAALLESMRNDDPEEAHAQSPFVALARTTDDQDEDGEAS